MSLWQIRTEDDLRIVLKELKRIAFGEFIDDLQLSSKITEAFGIQTVKVDDVGDKVGMERLGKDDIWSNFGATLIIACIVIVLLRHVAQTRVGLAENVGSQLLREQAPLKGCEVCQI